MSHPSQADGRAQPSSSRPPTSAAELVLLLLEEADDLLHRPEPTYARLSIHWRWRAA